ncbi:substrate-binding periplasmic protein [Amantichitinum ursilacus]|uniref:Bacterial extracellular solute-binding protein, family 3 n=1 Tax=Amantichitinum ursilacus TaxID=857265 RepID=A0A0N0XJZ9_9NEIS|nr:transporter substrate-binding domain-containing protein [Amantichitinum ursilacus]KPC52776.1 Bacterial extracellular solute-binding protein, family 3 [Amantichitinum ursilacus]
MRIWPQAVSALTVLLLASSTAARAEIGQQLEIASGPDYPPFADSNLPDGGMLTGIVRRAFALRGIQAQLTWLPWRRTEIDSANGVFAATFPYVKTPGRSQRFVYSQELYNVTTWVYAKPELANATPEELARHVQCVPQGYAVGEQAQARLGTARAVQQPASFDACARMVLMGRADFFLANDATGASILRGMPRGALVHSEQPFTGNSLYLMVPVSRKDAAFVVHQFNLGLEQLKRSGEYDRYIARYLKALPGPP